MERWIREAHKRKKIIINQQKLLKMHEHGFKKVHYSCILLVFQRRLVKSERHFHYIQVFAVLDEVSSTISCFFFKFTSDIFWSVYFHFSVC